jgi:hypothetical protein
MFFYSIGSASGAIAATHVYAHASWSGVCALGGAIGAVALLFWAATRHFVAKQPAGQAHRSRPRLVAD